MQKKRLAAEVLMIGTLLVRCIQLGDEIKRLYKVHKPKGPMGFTTIERKRWYQR